MNCTLLCSGVKCHALLLGSVPTSQAQSKCILFYNLYANALTHSAPLSRYLVPKTFQSGVPVVNVSEALNVLTVRSIMFTFKLSWFITVVALLPDPVTTCMDNVSTQLYNQPSDQVSFSSFWQSSTGLLGLG